MTIKKFIPTIFILHFAVSFLFAQVQYENAFPQLSFIQPVDLQNAGDNSNRIFVVEKQGNICTFENSQNVTVKKTFLNIQNRVNSSGGEEGLLGLAFHPNYENNGYFYVDYTASNPRRTVISRFEVSTANPDSADENSELVLLEVNQPYSNHNGGQVRFGLDNFLYISFGDGGSGGDPQGNGQDSTTLLASILRIDVDNPQGGLNYGIPADNPFVNNAGRDEIFAYGLRNPWRFSFDPQTGKLWAGDVGQNQWEEVDIIENGKNYGWNIMEGFHCYNSSSCDTAGLTLPIWEYGHNATGGNSITGGFVYRGSSTPELAGKYIYADYGSGRIWALQYDSTQTSNTELFNTPLGISAFGTDQNNELYFCTFDGSIYTFTSVTTVEPEKDAMHPEDFHLGQNFPNPFNPETTIPLTLEKQADIDLAIYDLQGREIKHLINRQLAAGDYKFQWDGTDNNRTPVSSGIYFYRLKTGKNIQTSKRMLLLR